MRQPTLLIIADDLTGANDTGVQFARQGISTLVGINQEIPLTNFVENCEVLVMNTESRHVTPDEAYARVFRLAQQGVGLGIPYFYKKIDSTLRGNTGSELAALLAATNERELFFAPAYPKLNRTTKSGMQFVEGVPLHLSSFSDDQLNPIFSSHLATILEQQTKVKIEIFDEQNFQSSVPTVPTIYVLNAACDEDLQKHAQRIAPHSRLLAGSAGWAACLPVALHFTTKAISRTPLSSPMLIVNGSLHENSLRQIEYAAQHGVPVVKLNSTQGHQQFNFSDRLILTTENTSHDPNVAEKLAQQVQQILSRTEVKTLVVFGGDTLAAIAQTLHWEGFRPHYEIFDGIPIVKICEAEELTLVTKAGGFGELDLLMKLIVGSE